ncbi:MAG: hypothetical protein HRU14_03850 [Planctomycetes bacterium]|nr:hypothetical protein [Planctomycetota bacterium]
MSDSKKRYVVRPITLPRDYLDLLLSGPFWFVAFLKYLVGTAVGVFGMIKGHSPSAVLGFMLAISAFLRHLMLCIYNAQLRERRSE